MWSSMGIPKASVFPEPCVRWGEEREERGGVERWREETEEEREKREGKEEEREKREEVRKRKGGRIKDKVNDL